MSKVFRDTSYEPSIVLDRVEGNLRIKGWDQPEVRFDADEEEALDVRQDDFKIEGHCGSSVYLRVPTHASIVVNTIRGEASFKSIEGDIRVEQIDGNATFKLLGSIAVQNIQSNLVASRIEGDLGIHLLQGNATLRDIEETFRCERIAGNLNYRGMGREIHCKVDGNANLRLETVPGGHYEVHAKNNINCKAEVSSGAAVQLHSRTQSIQIITAEGSDMINAKQHAFQIGEGNTQIHLEAGGRVELKVGAPSDDFDDPLNQEFAEDIATLAEDITHQVTEQLEAQMTALNDQLSNLALQFGASNSESAQRAAERAQRKVERAQRKLELKLSATQRRAEQYARKAAQQSHRGRPRFAVTLPGNNTAIKSDPIGDNERQTILQMLQDQKINVEEAEMLLSALEGDYQSDEDEVQPPPPGTTSQGRVNPDG